MPSYKPIKDIKDDVVRKRIIDKLLVLRKQLSREIPQKSVLENLLLATWNIREFGPGNRLQESYYYIAEILSCFDLVAIQEVAADRTALEQVIGIMGDNWNYIVTDSSEGSAGGRERMAFLYDTRKLTFKNLAGEIVLPGNQLVGGKSQFARTPFCVAFQAGWFMFNLTTVHIYYGATGGAKYKKRVEEIDRVSKFLGQRAKEENVSYILLGDFNIVNTNDDTLKALEKNDFFIPESIKQKPSDISGTKHYDQIAFRFKEGEDMVVFSEKNQKAGTFNYFKTIFTRKEIPVYREYFNKDVIKDKTPKEIETYYLSIWRTFQVSDHLPLWVQLKIDFSDEFLKGIG